MRRSLIVLSALGLITAAGAGAAAHAEQPAAASNTKAVNEQIRALAMEEARRQGIANDAYQAELAATQDQEARNALRDDFYAQRQKDGQILQDKIRALRAQQ